MRNGSHHARFQTIPHDQASKKAAIHVGNALTGHAALLVHNGDPFLDPTAVGAIGDKLLPADEKEVARFLVRVEIPARWIRVNLSLAENLLAKIDHAARELGMSRSGYFAEAARRMMGRG
ncbi:MAG: type II toxin-antitoxin system HicB family antitoxin [Magnetococcales bacterium]|nr:type II toxin-antitoxin system HicB family antitoxin [Magnetococcales bacterium]